MSTNFKSLTENPLRVRIVANYRPSTSFFIKPPSYQAGSALTLSCEVRGANVHQNGLLYEWRSSCGGNCFVRSGSTKSVSTPYLHSYDKGVHTCVVYDLSGCTGMANITVNIVGMWSHYIFCLDSGQYKDLFFICKHISLFVITISILQPLQSSIPPHCTFWTIPLVLLSSYIVIDYITFILFFMLQRRLP